ncbi:MAG: TolC family protein [Methylococcales bacterium]
MIDFKVDSMTSAGVVDQCFRFSSLFVIPWFIIGISVSFASDISDDIDTHWGSELAHQHAASVDDQYRPDLHHAVTPSQTLTLSAVLEHAVQYSPDYSRIMALHQESDALKQRGDSLLGGAPAISASYTDDQPFNNRGYVQAANNLQLPLWNWGQRAAGQRLGESAEQTANRYPSALLWEVAGIVREALWSVALQHSRLEKAEQLLNLAQKRLKTIERRVDAGDLARADLLLGQSDILAHESHLKQAEAGFVDANVHYINVSGLTQIPVNFSEQQSQLTSIGDNHPAIELLVAEVERANARISWVKKSGIAQPSINFGSTHERDDRKTDISNRLNIGISIPFGGGAFIAPKVAAANRNLIETMSKLEQGRRRLAHDLHEAEHGIGVDQARLEIAKKRNIIAKQYMQMSEKAFQAGEIRLLDLIRIQKDSETTYLETVEAEISLQRGIARYNQAVGELP